MILVNNELFGEREYHNGEVIFNKPSYVDTSQNTIEMLFESNKDITGVLFAAQYIRDVAPESACYLVMKYCPYERMDREINELMFSMKYFAEIIAKFNFTSVYILDPHSKVCVEQLRKNGLDVNILDLEGYIHKVVKLFNPDYICYPDKGAYTKYPELLKNIGIPYFYGEKRRDFENKGRISDYKLVNAPDLKDKKVLIIDDICCLGGTAYKAAYEMKMLGAKEVALYISHCENGIFVGKLLKLEPFYADGSGVNVPWAGKYTIDKVYTADTMVLKQWHKNIVKIN